MKKNDKFFPVTDAGMLASVLDAAADIILVLDKTGLVKEMKLQREGVSLFENCKWTGKNIREFVSIESLGKIDVLLQLSDPDNSVNYQQISHQGAENVDVPVSYRATKLNSQGDIILFGQSEVELSLLQRRLVESQFILDREINNFKLQEGIYKSVFSNSESPQFVVEMKTLRVVDLNTAANHMIGFKSFKEKKPTIYDLFSDEDTSVLHKLLLSSRDSTSGIIQVKLTNGSNAKLKTSYHFMDNKDYILLEVVAINSESPLQNISRQIDKIPDFAKHIPDAYILLDDEQNIVTANMLFYELFDFPKNYDISSLDFETLFEKADVDGKILFSNLKENGMVKNMLSTVKTHLGETFIIEIAGCRFVKNQKMFIGLSFRPSIKLNNIPEIMNRDATLLDKQVEGLVGSMSLKEIVRRTTYSIECLCIDVALKLTKNNRASAAQLLGISRQSLYMKMKSQPKKQTP